MTPSLFQNVVRIDALLNHLPEDMRPFSFLHPDVLEAACPESATLEVRASLRAYHNRLLEVEEQSRQLVHAYLGTLAFLKHQESLQAGERFCAACGVSLADLDLRGHIMGCPLAVLPPSLEAALDDPSKLAGLTSSRLRKDLDQECQSRRQVEEERNTLLRLAEDQAERLECHFGRSIHAFSGATLNCAECGEPSRHPIHTTRARAELDFAASQLAATDQSGLVDLTRYKDTGRLLRWIEAGAFIVLREVRRQGRLTLGKIHGLLKVYHDSSTTMKDTHEILEMLAQAELVTLDVDHMSYLPMNLDSSISAAAC